MEYAQESLDQHRSGIPDTLPGFKKEPSFKEKGSEANEGNGKSQDFGPATQQNGQPYPEGHTGHMTDGKSTKVKGGRWVLAQ
jgi:hypothetical protein